MRVPFLGIVFLAVGVVAVNAQTMSFENAARTLLDSCGKDIQKYCRTVNLGSGRMRNCLLGTSSVSAGCKTAYAEVSIGIRKRADARVAVRKLCDADARRLCGLVQLGDGQLLECLLRSYRGISAKCSQAITDAGYR